jgi:hypothetical protein
MTILCLSFATLEGRFVKICVICGKRKRTGRSNLFNPNKSRNEVCLRFATLTEKFVAKENA